jgi:Tol biopolymer transport system component
VGVAGMLAVASVSAAAHAWSPVEFATDSENQLGLTFSPDGSTAFWVAWNGEWGKSNGGRQVIYSSQRLSGRWSEPAPVIFSGKHSDSDPFVSPDGRWLYFISKRPTDADDLDHDANVWRFSLTEEHRLEHLSINSDAEEYSPVITTSGTLYFASNRDGGPGAGDLYRALPTDNGFSTPEPLGPALNSRAGEWNIWVSPDENEIIFEASSRSTNVSIAGDLYYSWHTPAGWTAAVPIEQLNTRNSDLMPRMSPDGTTLYYTSAPTGGFAEIMSAEWAPLRTALRTTYAPSLLVANRSSHEVTFVDLSRGEITARVATGQGPHLLSNVSEGRILATGFGEFPEPHAAPVATRPPFVEAPNSRLTLIDIAGRVAASDVRLENCAKPHSSWIIENRAYVTCEQEKRVQVIDLDSLRTIDQIETLQDGSHVLNFEAESRTLVTSNVDSGSVTLVDIDDSTTQVVKLAAGSEGSLAVDGRVWVANAIAGSVSVVDPHAGKEIERIESVCAFPIALSANEQEQLWVACFASAELVAIDSNDFTIKRRITLADQPLNLLLHPKLELAYVSLPRQNAVAEISLASGDELRRLSVGIEPDGLRWAQADGRCCRDSTDVRE